LVSYYPFILKWICWLHGIQANMSRPSSDPSGYMDKLSGEEQGCFFRLHAARKHQSIFVCLWEKTREK
jgi:hypothetical protein